MCGGLGYETPLGGLGPRVENHCLRLWWVVCALYISSRQSPSHSVPPESWTLGGHTLAGPLSGPSVGGFCIVGCFYMGGLLVQRPLPGIAVEVDVR